jgi:hypothetical protein
MLAAFIGLFIYSKANEYSQKSNRATVNNMLLNLDDEIYSDAITPETNYLLSALYFDESPDISAKEKANIILKNISGDSVYFTWSSIPELYDSIMHLGRSFNKADIEKYNRLLNGIVCSERVLFLVYRAFIQFRQQIITADDWEDFKAYIEDFSRSPLFLCAIHVNNKNGYFSRDFAKELQNVYKSHVVHLVDSCYSTVKEELWLTNNERNE